MPAIAGHTKYKNYLASDMQVIIIGVSSKYNITCTKLNRFQEKHCSRAAKYNLIIKCIYCFPDNRGSI